MLEMLVTFLENASFLAIYNQISAMSTTNVVALFLVSKPVFILASLFFLCVPRARGHVSGLLESESTNPLRLIDEPARALLE